jgi:hypothetical protein
MDAISRHIWQTAVALARAEAEAVDMPSGTGTKDNAPLPHCETCGDDCTGGEPFVRANGGNYAFCSDGCYREFVKMLEMDPS